MVVRVKGTQPAETPRAGTLPVVTARVATLQLETAHSVATRRPVMARAETQPATPRAEPHSVGTRRLMMSVAVISHQPRVDAALSEVWVRSLARVAQLPAKRRMAGTI